MKTLKINMLDTAKGVLPKADCFNVKLLRQGDGSGTMRLTVRWNQNEDIVRITGGVFIENSVEVTEAWRNSWGPELLIKVTSPVAYVYVQRNILGNDGKYRMFGLRENFNDPDRNSNSPIVDYTYRLYPLYFVSYMFGSYSGNPINQPISGIVAPDADYNTEGMKEFLTGCFNFNHSLNNLDTSFSKNFDRAFSGCRTLDQEVNHFNMSNAESCIAMLQSCSSFNRSMDRWKVGKVKNMSGMLYGCTSLDQDLSKWDFHIEVLLDSFISGCISFSPANYDKLLKRLNSYSWEGRTNPKVLGAEFVRYSKSGEADRNSLIAKGWTIIDAGMLV